MGEANNRGTADERREEAESKTIDSHARISLTAGPKGIDIQLANVDDPNNPAVRLGRWLCENMAALVKLCEHEDSQVSAALARAEHAEKLIIPATQARLLGPDGKPVN